MPHPPSKRVRDMSTIICVNTIYVFVKIQNPPGNYTKVLSNEPPPSLSLSSIMLPPSTLRIQNPAWHSWGKKERKEPGIFFFFFFSLFFAFFNFQSNRCMRYSTSTSLVRGMTKSLYMETTAAALILPGPSALLSEGSRP